MVETKLPRGGRRVGRAGASYPNRSDLAAQPVKTAPGQVYGAQAAQARAQQAVPLPTSPPAQAPAPQPMPTPPDPGMLHAPTARPGEPVTAGLPIGAGPGPEALPGGLPQDQVLANMYRAFQMAPSDGLRALIAQTERLNASPR